MKGIRLKLLVALAILWPHFSPAVDVANAPAEPTEFISEVIPIKYAKATELAILLRATNKVAQPFFIRLGERLTEKVGGDAIQCELEKMGPRQVEADERSNSLSVVAAKREMIALKEIIARLDFVLPQILVEAAIIEFPITYSTTTPSVTTESRPALAALSNLGFIVNTTFPFQHTNTGQLDQFSYIATLRGDLDSTFNALATNTSARILQRPRIQTSEGEPAMLFVGVAPPYPSGPYYSGASYSCGCVSSIRTVIVGRTFEVTCLLPAKDLIQLDINISTETTNGTVTIANVGEVPITSREASQAQTFLRNGEVIAIGGMFETNKVSIFSGIDRLDRIPGGYLNKLITYPKRTIRSELMLLMRAIVLPAPQVAALSSKDSMPRARPTEPEVP